MIVPPTDIKHKQESFSTRRTEWLCVMCKTQQEKKAADNLERQGFKVFLPMVESRGRKHGRITTNIKAMFPGYLFIATDLERQDLSVVRSTLGCVALLRHGARPAVVTEQIMASIKEAESVLRGRFEIDHGHIAGAQYELLEQGFHGHTATFLALDGKGRARVLVALLSTVHEVKVSKNSLGQRVS